MDTSFLDQPDEVIVNEEFWLFIVAYYSAVTVSLSM